MADKALTDEEVYDLLHQALSLLLNRSVMTTHAQDVLTMAIRDLTIIQTAFLTLSEKPTLLRSETEPLPRQP